jgi:hypothetical protein
MLKQNDNRENRSNKKQIIIYTVHNYRNMNGIVKVSRATK